MLRSRIGVRPLIALVGVGLSGAALAQTNQERIPSRSQSDSRGGQVQVGVLRCDVSGGIGLIVTSSREMTCRFKPRRGRSEVYSGVVQRFGLDIGATTRGVMSWAVFAPSNTRRSGALAGEYVGASAEATVGAGIGANVLVGGFENSLSLQPVSVQAQTGLNFATGVARLTLTQRRTSAR
jgi:hypothetical protein